MIATSREIKLAHTPLRSPRLRLREMGCRIVQRGPAMFLVVPEDAEMTGEIIRKQGLEVRIDELPLP